MLPNLFSVFMSLASYFFLPSPHLEVAPCISSHCFLLIKWRSVLTSLFIKQMISDLFIFYFIFLISDLFKKSEASHYIFLFEITTL